MLMTLPCLGLLPIKHKRHSGKKQKCVALIRFYVGRPGIPLFRL